MSAASPACEKEAKLRMFSRSPMNVFRKSPRTFFPGASFLEAGFLRRTGEVTRARAFSLVELLAVMAILATLSAVTIPALHSLQSGNTVNKAVADLSATLELARTYAMANRTYVRVVLSQIPAGGQKTLPTLIALPLYSADGTATGDLTDSTQWPALGRVVALENLSLFDTMQGASPVDTRSDVTPLGANVSGTVMPSFNRTLPGWGAVSFTGVVQFSPSGEARVCFDEPARYIKIAVDQLVPGSATQALRKNPFILRLSSVNGSIKVLRAGELVF